MMMGHIGTDHQCKTRLDLFYFLAPSDRTLDQMNDDGALLLITRSDTAADNTIGHLYQNFTFYFGQITVLNRLIAFYPLSGGSFLGTPQTSNFFKLPTF
jgi:hypothetical protein